MIAKGEVMKKKKKSWESVSKVETTKKQVPAKPSEPQKVPFSAWWVLASAKANFKPYLKDIILVDFKARGLTEEETLEDYYAALTKFGYTI